MSEYRNMVDRAEAEIIKLIPARFSLVGGVRLVLSFDDPGIDQWHAEIALRKPRKFNSWTLSGTLQSTAADALNALVKDIAERMAASPRGEFL